MSQESIGEPVLCPYCHGAYNNSATKLHICFEDGEPSMTPIPPIPEDQMAEEQLDAELREFGIDPEQLVQDTFAKLCVVMRAQSERIAKLTEALNEKTLMHLAAESEVDELEAENTRLKAPVTEEEYKAANGGGYVRGWQQMSAILASRATRTPPQEGQ